MAYDKTLIDKDGDEYPYSESIDEDGYYYQISIIWQDRDGELVILKEGAHLEFDDDGSWLDFNITPEDLFPKAVKLNDKMLLELLTAFVQNKSNARLYSKEQVESGYAKFLEKQIKDQ